MVAIGMGLVFVGYAVGMWGYCLVRGYNVPFTGMFGPIWPGGAADKAGLIGPAKLA